MSGIRGYGREEAYRGGNKVYGSGRSSPHAGTRLDPSGYVNRELNKQRVDRRSRLAESAINRLNIQTPTTKSTSPSPTFTKTPTTQVGGTSKPGGNPKPGEPPAPPAPPAPMPFTPPKVDLSGKLIPMPWDMQMDWLNATTGLAGQNAAWDQQVNQANTDLGISLRDMARQRVQDSTHLADVNSSRGMSFSSGNAYDIANQNNNYAMAESDTRNYVQDLMGRIGVGGTDRALAQGQYDQYASMLQAEAARVLAERAGTLGLGQDNGVPTPTPKPKPKPGGGKNPPKNKPPRRDPPMHNGPNPHKPKNRRK